MRLFPIQIIAFVCASEPENTEIGQKNAVRKKSI